MLVSRTRFLLAALWVGSLWTVGYLVAPTLFLTLGDRVLAGTIAGSLFRVEAWLSVAAALLLLLLVRVPGPGVPNGQQPAFKAGWLIAAMLACTAVGYFCLEPFMGALRAAAGPGGVMESAARTRFGILHAASTGFYMVESVLGVMLLLRLR